MASCEIDSGKQEDLMQRRKRVLNKSCIKCKTSQGNLVVRSLVYCKSCLQALVVQRFKKSFDEAIPPATAHSTVLAVGFSGGLGSTLLLDLVGQLLAPGSKRTRRHHWDKIYVIHVNEYTAALDTNTDIQSQSIEDVVSSYPQLTLVKVPLENAFLDSSSSVTPSEALSEYLKSMPTQTAVRDSTQILTRRMIERTALSFGATHLVLGRSMSSLSKALLSNICSGRAFSISDERKSQCDGLMTFNPLQDIGAKECAAYVWWRELRVVSSPIQQIEVGGSNASISELTRAFISGLEKDYPSTVSTIVKTCGKVVPRGEGDGKCRICARCMPAAEDLTSLTIIAITANQNPEHRENLCYACKTMLTSANSKTSGTRTATSSLPVWARIYNE